MGNALRKVLTSLKEWSKGKFGAMTKQIELLRERLTQLRQQGQQDSCAAITETLDKMNELLYREEMMWL